MGIFRYLLSTFVVLFHLVGGYICWGYSAVFGFYLISGYAITYVLNNKYKNQSKLKFFENRILRIYPIYFIYVCMTILVVPNDVSQLGMMAMIKEFSIGIIRDRTGSFALWLNGFPKLVPQAWTLWPQIVFYMLAPFIVALHNKRKTLYYLLIPITLIYPVYTYLNHMDFPTYRYRSIFGTFAIFLIGSMIYYIKDYVPKIKYANIVLFLAIALYAFEISFFGRVTLNEIQIYISVLINILILIISTQISFTGILFKVDKFFGNLSYGLFLGHFFGAYVLLAIINKTEELININTIPKSGMKYGIMVIIVQSIISLILYYLVEKPISKLKRN